MNIGFLGAGRMAEALIAGLLAKGFSADQIAITSRTETRRRQLAERFGVQPRREVASLLACEVVLLAVKPQQMKTALEPLRGNLSKPAPLFISLAAGIETDTILRWLGQEVPLARAMPNTPARIGRGITGLYAVRGVSREQRRSAEEIFRSVGEVVWLEEEALLDVVTALSGSGPAYLFYLMEAMIEAGQELGLAADTARKLATWTVWGAGELAAQEARHPEALRREVTSPGGTTERALALLERDQLKALVKRAVFAAHQRAGELAKILAEED